MREFGISTQTVDLAPEDTPQLTTYWRKQSNLTSKSRTRDNNVMHAKPDLRVFLKWMIAGSGSVITDVIPLKYNSRNSRFPVPTRIRIWKTSASANGRDWAAAWPLSIWTNRRLSWGKTWNSIGNWREPANTGESFCRRNWRTGSSIWTTQPPNRVLQLSDSLSKSESWTRSLPGEEWPIAIGQKETLANSTTQWIWKQCRFGARRTTPQTAKTLCAIWYRNRNSRSRFWNDRQHWMAKCQTGVTKMDWMLYCKPCNHPKLWYRYEIPAFYFWRPVYSKTCIFRRLSPIAE